MKKHLPLYIILFIIHFFTIQASLPEAIANPYTYKDNNESYDKKDRHAKKGNGKKRKNRNMLYDSLSEKDQKVFNEIMNDFDKDIRPLRKELKRKRKELRALYGENGVEDMDAFNQVQQEIIKLSNTIMLKRNETNKLVEEKLGIKLYDYKNMRRNHGLRPSHRQKCYSSKQ